LYLKSYLENALENKIEKEKKEALAAQQLGIAGPLLSPLPLARPCCSAPAQLASA